MKKYRAVWELGENPGYYTANRSLFAYDTIDEALDVLKKKTMLPFGTKMWIEVIDDADKENIVKLPVEKRLIVFENKGEKISRERLADMAGLEKKVFKNDSDPVTEARKRYDNMCDTKKKERTMEANIAKCPRCGSKAINIISYTNPRWNDKFAYCECDYCRLRSNEVKVIKDLSMEYTIIVAYEEWNKMAVNFNLKPLKHAK